MIPSDVQLLVTRNYGETANEKVNELVRELLIAVLIIVVLLAVSLGMREGLIVAIAVPVILSITLLGNYFAGYTINRVTLFALILSLGLLVDDPIVDVENIHRHFRLRTHPPRMATLVAVDEVRPPTVLATLAVIASFVPMLFVTGMMGPYMRPMPFNVPLAMLMSLVVAFTITPWAAFHLLRREHDEAPPHGEAAADESAAVRRWYARILTPLLERASLARGFLAAIAGAFVLSILLVIIGLVPVKMLPFDNKNELQVVIDLPEGTPLEATQAVVRDLDALLVRVPEITDCESYVGTASQFDFNGMVRKYYLRDQHNQGDIRIDLAPKSARAASSHAIALRLRPELDRIASPYHARIKVVEMPPGPPVYATVVAELRGPAGAPYAGLIAQARATHRRFARIRGLVDIDDSSIASEPRLNFVVDREKAALNGISVAQVARTLAIALGGDSPAIAHSDSERNPLRIELRMPRAARSGATDLSATKVHGRDGAMVSLGELGDWQTTVAEQPILCKDLHPIAMVTAEAAGISPVTGIFASTGFTLLVVPLIYYLVYRDSEAHPVDH